MGIDAEMVVKYRGEKPTDEQLTRWSWELCRAIGARHFFISDGLPAEKYREASAAWHAAYNGHALYAEFEAARNGPHEAWQAIRLKILADIGEPPKQLRRAIDLAGSSSFAYWFEDSDVPEDKRQAGMFYTQDGDTVLAAPGEYLLELSLWTRYYGENYERGDILTICAVAEWIEANMQPCEVWYGGDSSGVCIEPFGDKRRRELRRHLYGQKGCDYFSSWGTPPNAMPPKCGLCVPEEKRQQYGSGMGGNFAAVSCGGCGKNFETRDGGTTWQERKDD
jgi:hypothetical protein